MKEILLPNSRIVEIGNGAPVVGIVGLLHGDEVCGRIILDELARANLTLNGTILLVYANLEAEKRNVRGVEGNLNRLFPGTVSGNLEERTAFELKDRLAQCNFLLDIHSTSYPTEPFAISTVDNNNYDRLASFTGLSKYVIMTEKLANGGSLIDCVNDCGGAGISFESGTHRDKTSVVVARRVVSQFLTNLGVLSGVQGVRFPEKFYGIMPIKVHSPGFKAYSTIRNFELLKAGTPFGEDEQGDYSLQDDCYPFLFSDQLIDGNVFLEGDKKRRKPSKVIVM